MRNKMAVTLILAVIPLVLAGMAKAETPAPPAADIMVGDAVAARLEARSVTLGRLSEAVDQLAGMDGADQVSEVVFSGLYSGSTAGTGHPVVYPKVRANIPPPLKYVPAVVDSDRRSSADTAMEADGAEDTPAESTPDTGPAEGTSGSAPDPYVLLVLLILVLLLI